MADHRETFCGAGIHAFLKRLLNPGRVASASALVEQEPEHLGRLHRKVAIVIRHGSVSLTTAGLIATVLTRQGAKVLLVDASFDTPRECAGTPYEVYTGGPIEDFASAVRVVEACVSQFGYVTTLVNCIGADSPGSILGLSESTWAQAIQSCVLSPFLAASACIPEMLRSGSSCSIINATSSIAGVRALHDQLISSVVGGAIAGLTMSLAAEFGVNGVRCNCVLSALDDVPIFHAYNSARSQRFSEEDAGHPTFSSQGRRSACLEHLAHTGDTVCGPEDVANAVLYLASDEARNISGTILPVDGGLSQCVQLRSVNVNAADAAIPTLFDHTSAFDKYRPSEALTMVNKVVVVTGAGCDPITSNAWSIGKAIAVLLASHGAKVLIVDRSAGAAGNTEKAIKEIGGECRTHICDVADSLEVEEMIKACLATWGRLDCLVNSVGIVSPKGALETTEADFKCIFATNVKSMFLTCKHAVPKMLEAGSGSIVNISSVSGIRFLRPELAYTASKGAVNALTAQVGTQYARCGLRCNAVLPGLINTPLAERMAVADAHPDRILAQRRAACPTGAGGEASDVAHAVLYLCSNEARYTNCQLLHVDAGLSSRLLL
mmetsp:Transcript_14918/g.33999  ORF Transcript_14918/g.33999 Transcript_14918/m.33999 type:complete len:606 (+) Transcript_14918:116-1933(+)